MIAASPHLYHLLLPNPHPEFAAHLIQTRITQYFIICAVVKWAKQDNLHHISINIPTDLAEGFV